MVYFSGIDESSFFNGPQWVAEAYNDEDEFCDTCGNNLVTFRTLATEVQTESHADSIVLGFVPIPAGGPSPDVAIGS